MQRVSREQFLIVGGALTLLLFFTRYSYFGLSAYCANATMAVFFLSGLYLRRQWAFVALVLFAIGIDLVAVGLGQLPAQLITRAYAFEPLAYALLWFGARACADAGATRLRLFAVALLLTLPAFAVTNGAFYWLSGFFPAPSLGGWVANFLQWAPLFVGTTLAWVAGALLLHAGIAWITAARMTQRALAGHAQRA